MDINNATEVSFSCSSNGKIIFDIGGNKYRIVALIGFRSQRVFILSVGTHADYDRIDVTTL